MKHQDMKKAILTLLAATSLTLLHAQGEYDQLSQALRSPVEQMQQVASKKFGNMTIEQISQLNSQYDEAIAQIKELFAPHSGADYAPRALFSIATGMEPRDVKAIYDTFSPEVKAIDSQENQVLQALIAEYERTAPGSPAPEFETIDVNGDSITLQDLRGKIVVLDFWASWCGPCRANMPRMKELYKKYHDQGLEVVCIAADDQNQEAWRQAIEKDGTQLFRHILRLSAKPEAQAPSAPKLAAAPAGSPRSAGPMPFIPGMTPPGMARNPRDIGFKYNVHALPAKYLIDREGRIIGKVDDKEVAEQLQHIFGF